MRVFFIILFWSSLVFSQEKKEPTPENLWPPGVLSNLDTRPGRGLYVKSEDERFTFNLRARVQARYSYVANPDSPSLDREGFEIRRMRLVTRGNLYGKEWSYYVQLGFGNQDNENRPIAVRDAQILYNKWKFFRINMGQMKIPFNRQRWNSSSALQMVDRSIVNGELNLDRDGGLQIFSEDLFNKKRMFSYHLGIFGGNGRNTGLKSAGLLYVGKFTYSPFGGLIKQVYLDEEDDRLSESDVTRSSQPRIAFSLGMARNKGTDRAQSTIGNTFTFAKFDYLHHEVDMIFKWSGFSFMAEYMRRVANSPYREREDLVTGRLSREYSRSAEGFFVQGGYLFSNFYEISIRYGEYKPIGDTDPNLVYSREQGVGFSKYFDDHNLKIQADYFHITGSPASGGLNHQFRIQTQIFY